MQLRILALATAAALAASRIAAACDDAATDDGPDTMYSPGVLIGAATNRRQHFTDPILGGEVSVFGLKDWSDWRCGNGAPVPAPGISSGSMAGSPSSAHPARPTSGSRSVG